MLNEKETVDMLKERNQVIKDSNKLVNRTVTKSLIATSTCVVVALIVRKFI